MEKKEIETKVEEILENFPEVVKDYIDVLKLAHLNGFTVGSARWSDPNDGFIIVSDKEKIPHFDVNRLICVNADRDFFMKRFIIAHELGHFFLSQKESSKEELPLIAKRSSVLGKSPEENEFDYFAACLLLPSEKVLSFSDTVKSLSKNSAVRMISSIFMVPAETALRRCKELNIFQ